ncbi:MAG TPA: hypothetical protein VL326_18155 [Kofleriaceae bacterium]|nr:hypothetical protein [Kofleriaceae bacterium]
MTAAATFCCIECRLLQAPATECRECGSAQMAALAFETEVLRQKFRRQRGKLANAAVHGSLTLGALGAYVGVVAGGVLVSPIIPAVALGTVMGSAMLMVARRNRRITTVPLLAPKIGEGAVTKRGIARKLAETIETCDGAERVLVEEALLRGKADGVYFRRTRAARFAVDTDGGERVVVDGLVRASAQSPKRTPAKAGTDPRLLTLGIEGVAVAGQLELAIIRDGDPVEVTGDPVEEAVPELAFDRDAGQATVMRGRAKAVVLLRRV